MSRILVIDDSDLVRQLIVEALQAQGFETEWAADANSGYQKALEWTPDLIVLDVQLPDVTGIELCRVFRNRTELSKIPILIVTGNARQAQDKARGLAAGANDYMLKPFENTDLVARIRRLLGDKTADQAGETERGKSGGNVAAEPMRREPAPIDRQPAQEAPRPVDPVSSLAPNRPRAVVPEAPPSPDRPRAAAPVVTPPPLRFTRLHGWLLDLIFDPNRLRLDDVFPKLSVTFLGLALGLSLAGVALTAGPGIKPVVAALWICGTWGMAIAALVMSTSIMGLHMRWRDGALLISLAGIPILIKIAGGAALSILTSLSPFYFTVSPALLWPSAPWIFERLDLLELWSVWLLWTLFDKIPGSSIRQRRVSVALVWMLGVAMAAVLAKLNGAGTP